MRWINKDILHLHFIILIWGGTAIIGKLLSISPIEIVFYRTLFSAIAIGSAFLLFKKKDIYIPFREIITYIAIGILIAAHWILFFASIHISNVSICLAGVATCSFWTSIIEPIFNKKKIKKRELSLSILVVLGIYIMFSGDDINYKYMLGLIMSILAAILAAFFSVINAKMSKKQNNYVITFYEMVGACLVAGILLVSDNAINNTPIFLPINFSDLILLLVLAIICTAYAYAAAVGLMKRLTAYTVNLSVNLEPIYGIVMAYFIFGESEKMSIEFYVGGLLVLLTVFLHPILERGNRAVISN